MDREQIERWNTLVGLEDVVYHLGDFCMGGPAQAARYFSLLNGKIMVLNNPWHHDQRWQIRFGSRLPGETVFVEVSEYVSRSGYKIRMVPAITVFEAREYSLDGKHPLPIILCHFPIARWDRRHYGSVHLHGHTHGQYKAEGRIMDVGVDVQDFFPVSINAVAKSMLSYRPAYLDDEASISLRDLHNKI